MPLGIKFYWRLNGDHRSPRNKHKTRFLSGFWFVMPKELFAAQRWPAFKRLVVVSFPVRKIGSDLKERVKIESQIGSVFEENPDFAGFAASRDFDSLHDLASYHGERVPLASFGTLRVSQFRLLLGELVRAASVPQTRRSPLTL